ncbi:Fic family protein [Echinicola rosea]|uniref:Adenosine monophosphate-protein transferase n=1 Tax=Echinicola rosea TaxID=1807691 RepID=A0ABQ1VBU0_9BACT|nr:Fic/DOC family N-terminal domain-containing protein [Echinicola rosea]GGF50790.1 adenosine monophosphate-protein transferase [Echinicola rosea]
MNDFNKSQPYNNLPLLPPRGDLETKEILTKTIKASRALAQLNGAIRNLPNPSLFLDTLHLQEAKASSEIENIITTNDDLYQAVVADKKFNNPATKEVICYKEAIWIGFKKLEKKPFITTNLCVELVQCIKQNTAGIRTTPGTTLSNTKGEVIYTPPSGEQVIRGKMANLETFINENDSIDPLIKMAISHYQFEAIHPFSDGNGRTGRILLLLQLKLEQLLDIPALFLSEYIIDHKDQYYKGLRAVTEKNDWSKFIIYMLDMVETTAIKGLDRLESIIQLMEITGQEIKEKLPKVYSKDLVEVIFKLPYTKRQNLIDIDLGTPKTVGNYLSALEEEGFLKSVKVGKEKLYLNQKLMNILEN